MAIFAGVGLAAACGFRVFLPLFVASLAANMGIDVSGQAEFAHFLGDDFQWLGDTPITVALGAATLLEVASYYIPWIDNFLDMIATPAALVAGTFITGALMPEFVGDGSYKWIAATIAGGGTAGLVQVASVMSRSTATAATGGIGNPFVATAELASATATASLAVLLPFVMGFFVLLLLYFVVGKIIRHLHARRACRAIEVAKRL
jgi:hypothetical protein